MEFEILYSAALERAGLCPGLSTYQGTSTAYAAMTREKPAPPAPSVRQPIQTVEMPTYGQVRQRVKRGYTIKATAKFFQIRVCDVRRLLHKGDVAEAYRAGRAAA